MWFTAVQLSRMGGIRICFANRRPLSWASKVKPATRLPPTHSPMTVMWVICLEFSFCPPYFRGGAWNWMSKTKITYIFVFCGRPPVTKSRVVTYTIHRDLPFRKKRIQSVIFELTLPSLGDFSSLSTCRSWRLGAPYALYIPYTWCGRTKAKEKQTAPTTLFSSLTQIHALNQTIANHSNQLQDQQPISNGRRKHSKRDLPRRRHRL